MFQLSRNFIRNTVPAQTRLFSASTARFVKVGDSIPKAAVYEDSPGNQIDLAEETASGKSIIIGVPGAFSPACSSSHVPGFIKYLSKFEEKGYKKIFVVSINDAFVQKAWGELLLDGGVGTPFSFVADPFGKFTDALDLKFDASKFFGNERSKRYVLLVDNGKVTKSFIEPDNTGVDVSTAENVLKDA